MGYTHYWRQSRPFTEAEWTTLTAEAKRICSKAIRGEYYTGKEDFASATTCEMDELGFRHGFKEDYAWRTFPNPDAPIPQADRAIKLAGPNGTGKPQFTSNDIALNGVAPKEDYESFVLERSPVIRDGEKTSFDFTKTEYRPYDAVVVSILFIAQKIAPDAIKVSSDGGDEAIKLMF